MGNVEDRLQFIPSMEADGGTVSRNFEADRVLLESIRESNGGIWNQWKEKQGSNKIELKALSITNENLEGYNFSETTFTRTEVTDCVVNGDFYGAIFVDSDFSRTRFVDSNFRNTNARNCKFISSFLEKIKLEKSQWDNVNFLGSKILKSNFWLSHFDKCIFVGAKFDRVNLCEAQLVQNDFENAEFSECEIGPTKLFENNFYNVSGLDQFYHRSTSSIDVRTVMNPNFELPNTFLRGIGIPNVLLDYLPSLKASNNPLQFYSCFISYSHQDEEFARKLYSRLRDSDISVWFAPEDLRGGEKLHQQIDEAIKIYDKLLVILSPNSIKSDWVQEEILKARKKELKSGKRTLFPLRLGSISIVEDWQFFDGGRDMAREIREYYIPDFSKWSDESKFIPEFKKLVDALHLH